MHYMAEKRGGGLYVLMSYILWLAAEYVTVWNTRLGQWTALMPYILIQYLVIVLTFYWALFRLKLTGMRQLIFMLGVMYIWEIIWGTFNQMDTTRFIGLSIILATIWVVNTFAPLWTVNKIYGREK